MFFMKKKLKLTNISKGILLNKEMLALRGGTEGSKDICLFRCCCKNHGLQERSNIRVIAREWPD